MMKRVQYTAEESGKDRDTDRENIKHYAPERRVYKKVRKKG
jgi:hypothetical protein